MLLLALASVPFVSFAHAFSDHDIDVMSYWNTRPSRIVSDVRSTTERSLADDTTTTQHIDRPSHALSLAQSLKFDS